MMPQLVVRPASKTSSTISHDDIPPQPLDPGQHEAPLQVPIPLPVNGQAGIFVKSSSHDQPDHGNQPQSPDAIVSNHVRSGAGAFHRLPVEVLER